MRNLLITLFVFAALLNSSKSLAVAIADGSYILTIDTTPEVLFPGSGIPLVGTDGNWNTSFSINTLPNLVSSGMYDEIVSDVGVFSTVAGNGNAGKIGLVISGGNIAVTSFQVDTIANTTLSNFAQAAPNLSLLSGTTSDSITNLDLTNHIAAIDTTNLIGPPANLIDGQKWNYGIFTTGNSLLDVGGFTSINGTPVVNAGDMNGDSIDDYYMTLVNSGVFGPEWSGVIEGNYYIEIWQAQVLSSPVPVPAAVWLFGSGLLGLIGIAKGMKSNV
jgi:hypothetical protein